MEVTPASASLSFIGETVQLSAEVRDQNGRAMPGASVAWASSDVAVATVDGSGLVRGVADGVATMTAAAGDAEGTSKITVTNPDRGALVALYEATDGPNWENHDNWLTDAPLGDWYGVRTDASGRVASLYLVGNNLAGSIPPELGDFPRLEELTLSGNYLTGSIPSELGQLANLTTLDVAGNKLSGPIPPELGNLAELGSLVLGARTTLPEGNHLSGPIPAELGNLANLRELSLGSNDLSGPIPPELGNLANLEGLHLFDNGLSGSIPPELGRLASLTVLYLGGNDLLGPIPPELPELAELGVLYLRGTDVCVPGVGRFVRWIDGMESFDGSYCNASDVAVLESLYENAGGRDWTNSDGWLGGSALEEWHGVEADSLGRVSTLDLTGNGLAGPLPSGLGLLAELTELRIGDNGGLVGRLPVLLTGLSLSVLHYAGTALCSPADDSFRAWLGGVASHEGTTECAPLTDRDVLAVLYEATDGPNWAASDNWLTDAPLSDWHGVLTDASGRVWALSLGDNGLSGPIPPELGRLANLTGLSLQENDLFGPIPPELGGLANLRFLDLSRNDLSGPIPPELGGLTSLFGLSLRRSGLSGPIPPELGRLTSLEHLSAPENRFSGPIPPEVGDLAALKELNLGWTGISGPIPPELGDLANLERLYLDDNDLSGPIPPELGGLARLSILSLPNNDLSGPLPSWLGRLGDLSALDVTNNAAMMGILPASLIDLRNLEALYARGTGLCVPADAPDLQAWLAGVPQIHVADCAPSSAYLVQAVQSREFPVPLVAGEEALLRVFVTAARESDAGMPPVRARFHLDGTEIHMVDVAGSSVPIPTEIDEGDLSKSANAVIPGELVRPGLEMVIEVDPDGTLDPTLGVAERIPATGRLAVEVREMPPFDLTVIPFLWASEPDSSVIGFSEDMASDPKGHELLAPTHTLLPVADFEVTAHAPVTTSSNIGFDVLRETFVIRALEGGDGHHMGLMASFSDLRGLALGGGRVSVSVPHGGVIAHELGHNMSLRHAPCGGAGGVDPRYPTPDGSIGAWGYDFPGGYDIRRGGELVGPWTDDVMGYCDPRWISDYQFRRAFGFRLASEGATAAASAPSILIWGGVDGDGVPFLDPTFVVDAPRAVPDAVGEHTVVGRTADGIELFSLNFAMPEIADADGASGFAFVVPAEPGWAGTLASLTLTGPGGEATLDGATDRPMAILRDPRSGDVRGFLRDLAPTVAASDDLASALSSEPGLEALFSRGIPDPSAWRR